jgi:hypothetical protein
MMITHPSDLTQVTSNGTTPHSGQNTDTIVVAWNKVALQAIRDTHPGPPMVARMLAVVHTCMFDAWAAYDEVAVGTRLGGLFRRPLGEHTPANKIEAISYAAYRALADLFPTQVGQFDAFLAGLGYSPANVSLDPTTPAGIGNLAARQVLAFRHNDGSNQLGDVNGGAPYSDYTGYASVNTPDQINDPNRWQPLSVSDGHGGTVTQHYIAPHWGLVIPFALTSGSQFRPTEPVLTPADPDEFKEQCAQVLVYSANLTHTQKVIAEYWADGPSSELPPGHWCLFAQYVSARDAHDLDADVKMFFALTNAIFDASISAWDAKRAFDSVRPVTAIHHVFKGKQVRAWGGPKKGPRYMLGEKWQPYQAATVVTPPFPEYISGHSIFSAAGAEILTKFTGSDAFGASVTIPAGSSAVEPGTVPAQDVTLAWPTFADAAAQAGLSRRYGGIHFAGGDLVGRALGRVVAEQAWDKAQAFITGSA